MRQPRYRARPPRMFVDPNDGVFWICDVHRDGIPTGTTCARKPEAARTRARALVRMLAMYETLFHEAG